MTTSTQMMKLAAAALVMASMAACTPKRAVEPAVPNTPPAPSNPIYPTPNGNVGGDTLGSARPGSEQDFVVNVGDRVYFELDSYNVSSEAFPRLDAQAQWLARYPQITVRIEGNADERGTREYNLALGARRAESVRNALIQRGVSAARIDTISFGKERPIAEGSTEDSWARNRNGHTAIVSGAQ